MLLDNGSMSNLLTMTCCQRLGLPFSKLNSSVFGIGGNAQFINGKTNMTIYSRVNPDIKLDLEILLIEKVTPSLPEIVVDISRLEHLKNITLADPNFHLPGNIDGIIGATVFAEIMGNSKIRDPKDTLTAFETSLEQGIDEDSLFLLTEDNIKEIIPTIGPRLKILKRIQEHKEQEKQVSIIVDELPSVSTNSEFSVSSNATMEDNLEIETELENLFNESTQPASLSSFGQCSLLPVQVPEEQPRKKIKLNPAFPEGLEAILKRSVDGRIVLLHKNNLNNDMRQKLCKEIINYFLTICDDCTLNLFVEAAEEICQLFPNESKEIYYIPYQRKSGIQPKQSARGKLWSRYCNVKSALKTINNSFQSQQQATSEIEIEEDSQVQDLYNALKCMLEPYTKVLQYWERTFAFRRKLFKNKNINIAHIFNEIPALKLHFGAELIDSDFNQLYPEKIDLIYTTFPRVSQAIIACAKSRKIKVLDNDTDVDQYITALLTLPYLFAPITIRTSSPRLTWRPSRSETADSFVLNIKNLSDLDSIVKRRTEKLRLHHLTLQPFLVILGELNNITRIFVCIDEVKYPCDSILRALEVLFKTFHAFDVRYPAESEHVWTFLEEILYNLKTSKRNSAASALVADLRPLLN
ncbi:unnamed protein product [Psylliodes chrysocephalus]|uniref:Peptidase A2 domain-containing protein n=1 Tax=Psylliodes chrysocephalus TaxID=3402493 RepID=A0A9P0CN86_9CUCU|nr:unnamed protein product [Psylliodes chrysocephala]